MSSNPGTPVIDLPATETAGERRMVLNMGPQHPATHGVLRLVVEIDGEIIVSVQPEIGYLHTGIEKTCEAKFYQQVVPLTDRINYLDPLANNLCYCLAVEKLLGLEIPERAQWMRVLLTELTRLNSHLIWLGTHAMDIGALTVFLYTFREREEILRIFEGRSRPAHDDQLLPHRRPLDGAAARFPRPRAAFHHTHSQRRSTNIRICSPAIQSS